MIRHRYRKAAEYHDQKDAGCVDEKRQGRNEHIGEVRADAQNTVDEDHANDRVRGVNTQISPAESQDAQQDKNSRDAVCRSEKKCEQCNKRKAERYRKKYLKKIDQNMTAFFLSAVCFSDQCFGTGLVQLKFLIKSQTISSSCFFIRFCF